jgi:hypothetical protein
MVDLWWIREVNEAIRDVCRCNRLYLARCSRSWSGEEVNDGGVLGTSFDGSSHEVLELDLPRAANLSSIFQYDFGGDLDCGVL